MNKDNIPLYSCIAIFAVFIINFLVSIFSYNLNLIFLLNYIYMPLFALYVYKKNKDSWNSLREKKHNGIKYTFYVLAVICIVFNIYMGIFLSTILYIFSIIPSILGIINTISVSAIVFLTNKNKNKTKLAYIFHVISIICTIFIGIIILLFTTISLFKPLILGDIIFLVCCAVLISFQAGNLQKDEIEYDNIN